MHTFVSFCLAAPFAPAPPASADDDCDGLEFDVVVVGDADVGDDDDAEEVVATAFLPPAPPRLQHHTIEQQHDTKA